MEQSEENGGQAKRGRDNGTERAVRGGRVAEESKERIRQGRRSEAAGGQKPGGPRMVSPNLGDAG